jgi:hypothetical protein
MDKDPVQNRIRIKSVVDPVPDPRGEKIKENEEKIRVFISI